MPLKRLLKHVEPRLTMIRRFLPGIAFFCGFTWDSLTLGKGVSFFSLLVLTSYFFGAGLFLVLLVREVKPQWQNGFTFLVQFFFGGLFSALVIFYFKSSGSLYTFFVVLCLVALLIANEFISERYLIRSLSWALFAACSTMYLNFLIPHIVHSIRAIWFYLSCGISLCLVYFIHHVASAKQHQKKWRQLAPAMGVVLVLAVLYQLQLIPPVPLVLKENYICKNFSSEGGVYQCQAEKQVFWRALGFGGDIIHFQPGEKIYNLSAVFAPTHITVNLEQRWWMWDETQGRWLARGLVPLPMLGGRKAGWRTYSYINTTVRSGRWKVETAMQDGSVLGVYYFTAMPQGPDIPKTHTVKIN